MNPLVIGTPEDVVGFALAGVEGIVCATREEAEEAIRRANQDALLLVSAEWEAALDAPFNRPIRSLVLPRRE